MSSQWNGSAEPYEVSCFRCNRSFDTLRAPWCSCPFMDPSLVCPHCAGCSCDAPAGYNCEIWANAPASLWRRKWNQYLQEYASKPPRQPAERETVALQ